MPKRINIIGAGPGGLAAGMMLAGKGYDVHVFEKNGTVGGRNSELRLGDYTFDKGPTFLSMIHIVEELFQASGRNVHDYMNLVNLDPMYELIFEEKTIRMTSDRRKMKKQIEMLYPGNGEGYERFMEETARKMKALTPILQDKMDRFMHYVRPKVIKAVPELELGKTLYDVLSRYFTAEELKLAFTFQSKYLGMSPWECPGAFSILSYMEHAYGVYHPIGGVNMLSKSMARVLEEHGGKIHLHSGVKQIWTEGRSVRGVILESGERIKGDELIINGDFAHVMTKLVEPGLLKKYSADKLKRKKYSCSTFMLYVGVNKTYELPHHSIVFSKDYQKNVEEITKSKILSMDPSIYIQNPSVTDHTLAPEGKSALYILAPVPNNFSQIDWKRDKENFRKIVLDAIEEKTHFKGIRDHIEVEHIVTPDDWEHDANVYKGAVFNLGHQLSQMMVFRPHNKFEELEHCWLVGGGTHPGSGLPTILESARITANGILEEEGMGRIPVMPLPKVEGLR
ncbi:phytoene desaturase family protein [Falsibacillus pallidus]|uniref:phytoene desaturase family protein n=1 Tax=Falsibacillus pallidus TaxID=493781 RepID=UPI003D950DB4